MMTVDEATNLNTLCFSTELHQNTKSRTKSEIGATSNILIIVLHQRIL